MRKLFSVLAVTVFFSGLTLAVAADEKTLTGDAVCAKCALKESKTCQNVLSVKDGDKTVKYYLEGEASKKAHSALGICTAKKDAPIKIKVTGVESEKDGKKILTASKVEAAK